MAAASAASTGVTSSAINLESQRPSSSQIAQAAASVDELPIIDSENAPTPMPTMAFSFHRPARRKSGPSRFETAKLRLLSLGPSWCMHTEIQRHLKLILLSSFFCTFGIVLFLVGVVILSRPPHPNYSGIFIVGGVIVFIPGVYHLVYVLRAYLGHDGYMFQDLPIMD